MISVNRPHLWCRVKPEVQVRPMQAKDVIQPHLGITDEVSVRTETPPVQLIAAVTEEEVIEEARPEEALEAEEVEVEVVTISIIKTGGHLMIIIIVEAMPVADLRLPKLQCLRGFNELETVTTGQAIIAEDKYVIMKLMIPEFMTMRMMTSSSPRLLVSLTGASKWKKRRNAYPINSKKKQIRITAAELSACLQTPT